MNVLYLTINPNRQSTTVPTEGWIRCLPARGLRPVLASHEVGAFHEWVNEQGVASYHVPLPHPSKSNPLPLVTSLWKLRSIVRRHHIDLIHCNEQDCYPIGSYLSRVTGLPIVVSVHFTMARGFCEWAFGGRRCPDRMFFISRGNVEACRAGITSVVPENRWRTLYNGIDLKKYFPDEARRTEFRHRNGLPGSVAIGVACALRPRKQLEHLFRAAARVNSDRLKVIVAGGPVAGDEQYAARLLADAQATLGSRLVLLGHLDELRDFYNGLDVFVNTSQEEACSISVIEALACGCPVLGYPSKSVDDQILPEGGEIVLQDSIAQLAKALSRWLADSESLASRRIGARKQAESRFDIRKLADGLWDEYVAVLAERDLAVQRSAEPVVELQNC